MLGGRKILRLQIVFPDGYLQRDESIPWMGKFIQLCTGLCNMTSEGVCYTKNQLCLMSPGEDLEHLSLGEMSFATVISSANLKLEHKTVTVCR